MAGKTKRLALALLAGQLQIAAAETGTEAGIDKLLAMSLEDLMAVTVKISTSTAQTLAKAPSAVSVITADDIRATGATNLVDVLQGVPGIYIRHNYFGNRPLITFRGAAGTHALLMINGAPVKDLVWNSGIYWHGLPTSMIERVEIIRGPGSALYGSDASAGAINVITKTAGRIAQSEAGVRAGSFDTLSAWLQHGATWNGLDINFTADVSRTDSHRPLIERDNQTARDAGAGPGVSYAPGRAEFGWENQDLRFSAAHGHWRLHADLMRKSNVAVGLVGAGVLDPTTRGGDRRYNVDLFYDNPAYAKDWGLNAEVRYVDLYYTSGNGFQERPPGFACTGASTCGDAAVGTYANGWINQQRSAERRLNLELSGLYTGIRSHALRVGGGYMVQNLRLVEHYANYGKAADGSQIPLNSGLVDLSDSPYAFAPEKTRKVRYLFVQDVWNIAPAWELTAGARYDDYSDFGGTTNPRLALVWQTSDRLTTKLMYGQAFRAPSYLELYAGAGGVLPNSALKPERSKTWDLGFSWSAAKDLTLGLDFFRFEQTDLIGSVASKYQNVGTYTASGVEAEAQWQATKTLRLAGSLTRRAEEDTPYRSFNVPKQKTYLRADWAFMPRWNWNLQATRTGAHNLPAVATKPLAAYTLVDTTLRYSCCKDWEVAASVRNLFDTDAREYAGTNTSFWISEHLPLPRRNLYLEARYRF